LNEVGRQPGWSGGTAIGKLSGFNDTWRNGFWSRRHCYDHQRMAGIVGDYPDMAGRKETPQRNLYRLIWLNPRLACRSISPGPRVFRARTVCDDFLPGISLDSLEEPGSAPPEDRRPKTSRRRSSEDSDGLDRRGDGGAIHFARHFCRPEPNSPPPRRITSSRTDQRLFTRGHHQLAMSKRR